MVLVWLVVQGLLLPLETLLALNVLLARTMEHLAHLLVPIASPASILLPLVPPCAPTALLGTLPLQPPLLAYVTRAQLARALMESLALLVWTVWLARLQSHRELGLVLTVPPVLTLLLLVW